MNVDFSENSRGGAGNAGLLGSAGNHEWGQFGIIWLVTGNLSPRNLEFYSSFRAILGKFRESCGRTPNPQTPAMRLAQVKGNRIAAGQWVRHKTILPKHRPARDTTLLSPQVVDPLATKQWADHRASRK